MEFPETGDDLIIASNPSAAQLTVSGDRDTGDVTRMRIDEPDGSLDAEFDDQGRPTRVVIDGSNAFDMTYNVDGTFNYTLTESGVVTSEGSNLVSDDTDLESLGVTVKAGVRLQGRLESLTCAGDVVDDFAQFACIQGGFKDASDRTVLGDEVKSEKKAVNAGLLLCASAQGLNVLGEAEKACGADECADVNDGSESADQGVKDCCRRILKARAALKNMIGGGIAVLSDIIGAFLDASTSERTELCGGLPTAMATFTLRNADSRENIHIFLPSEGLNPTNRVTPGSFRQVTLEGLEQGQQVQFNAGRSIAPNLGSTTCPEIVGDNTTFDVIWNGASLSCGRT
ncbi:MAG: hypothetical protein ACE5GE_06390 [Phycisphaerae bacterium]